LSDDEREKIGACYKNKGQAKAIELGHELVQGDVKNKRIEEWIVPHYSLRLDGDHNCQNYAAHPLESNHWLNNF
jgi:hypothetical protein